LKKVATFWFSGSSQKVGFAHSYGAFACLPSAEFCELLHRNDVHLEVKFESEFQLMVEILWPTWRLAIFPFSFTFSFTTLFINMPVKYTFEKRVGVH
jgi:hypothetical protein